ncbi:unnamed protein product [Cyclocybe aegerita]|uniref:PNPLA domain-containing protein n=1 Tax=Cyclocybe aegerita TaxID=1973307 RepID=A0A8S0X909_CYCAE|nr:unnamed protein product [Cyclocybe aegerita]
MRPLCVLSIDGGGIRGIIPLLILREIMRHLQDVSGKELKPCEVFHLIGGTSAGGLIALMLGRMRMTVDECIIQFRKLSEQIFREPTRTSFFTRSHWYSSETLENALKEVIKDQTTDSETPMQDDDPKSCPTFVVAVQNHDVNHPTPILFRTYQSPLLDRTPSPRRAKIWQAARATAAAPKYFPPFRLGEVEYIDGGLGHNNPAPSIQREARSLTTSNHPIGCMISLGTGVPGTVTFKVAGPLLLTLGRILNLNDSLTAMITDAEKTHENTKTNAAAAEFNYFRFNPVLPSPGNFPLDAWEKIGTLQDKVSGVDGYTSRVDEELLYCAEIVNEFRRRDDENFSSSGPVVGDVDFIAHSDYINPRMVAHWGGDRGPHNIARHHMDIPAILHAAISYNSTPLERAEISTGGMMLRFVTPSRGSEEQVGPSATKE